jgi:hypothetical protein
MLRCVGLQQFSFDSMQRVVVMKLKEVNLPPLSDLRVWSWLDLLMKDFEFVECLVFVMYEIYKCLF